MAEYSAQYSSNDSICPYCKSMYQVEGEDYKIDEAVVVECDNCGKKYFLTTTCDVTHESKADCKLNGEPHKYEWQFHKRSISGSYFCTACEKRSNTGLQIADKKEDE